MFCPAGNDLVVPPALWLRVNGANYMIRSAVWEHLAPPSVCVFKSLMKSTPRHFCQKTKHNFRRQEMWLITPTVFLLYSFRQIQYLLLVYWGSALVLVCFRPLLLMLLLCRLPVWVTAFKGSQRLRPLTFYWSWPKELWPKAFCCSESRKEKKKNTWRLQTSAKPVISPLIMIYISGSLDHQFVVTIFRVSSPLISGFCGLFQEWFGVRIKRIYIYNVVLSCE